MTRILLTGASGRIGRGLVSELENLLNPGAEVDLLEHKIPLIQPANTQLNFKIIYALTSSQIDYDLAIHLGANTDTAYCQKHPEETRTNNVDLTRKVCNQSKRVIMLSTDYVFNGDLKEGEVYKETDPINPFNNYGETKAASEDIVLGNNGTVLRIETMMGVSNRIVDAARKAIIGEDTDYYPPYTNFSIRPSNFKDLLGVLGKVIPENHPGIYHVSCSGDALPRARIAQIVLEIYKEKAWRRVIDEFRTEEFRERKRFALGTEKAASELGISFTDAETAIRQHVLRNL